MASKTKTSRKPAARKTAAKTPAKAAETPPPKPEPIDQVAAETEALRFRTMQIGDNNGGLAQGLGSIGDLIRHTFTAYNRGYGEQNIEGGRSFLRDALLCAADDFDMAHVATLHGDANQETVARFVYRAEARARLAVELDHRLELGLREEASSKAKVTP